MNSAEKLPQSVREALADDHEGLANVIVALPTDLSPQGSYEEEWLVITDARLTVFSENGGSPGSSRLRARLNIALSQLKSPRTDLLVGGGALLAEVDGETIEVVRFTSRRQRAFERVARYLVNLAKYHETPDDDPDKQTKVAFEAATEDEERCPRCGLLFPSGTTACPACVGKIRVLRRLFGYLKPYKFEAALLSVLMVSSTILGLVGPYLTRPLMDVVLAPQRDVLPSDQRLFWLAVIVFAMLGSQIFGQLISIMQGRVSVRLSHRLAHALRVEVYRHLQRLSLRFFDKRQVGALLTRVTQDAQEIESVLSTGAQFFIANTLTLVGIVVVLCLLNWQLFLQLIIPIPIVLIFSRLFWSRIQSLWPRWWRYRGRLNAAITENLSGMRVVKAFAQEEREVDRFEPRSYDLAEAGMRAEQTWTTVFPVMTFITGLGALIVWYFGGKQVVSGTLSLGTLLTFIAYLSMFYGPLQFANRFYGWLGRALAASDRVFDILDTSPDVPDAPHPIALRTPEGRVEFRDVTFGYDEHKPVIHDFNLKVEPGEMIGLVGHSGAGKTTTINLLCRLYDVQRGQVLIDGIDVRQIRQRDLRQHFGLVMQDAFLFDATIADNISYAKSDATRDEMITAAKAANAHDFIMAKPDAYDTIVGERGNSLSFGERQRISIARAILHNPRFLILDEATSAVDTDTEKQIQEALARLVKGRTTIAIAHRLSTLRNADRLVVIKGGKLEEVGTHDELMAKQGEFYRLVEMQQAMSRIIVSG